MTPLVIKATRETCGLSQRDAAKLFGNGPKAFEKYESGNVSPSSSMTRLLLATKCPNLFQNWTGVPTISGGAAEVIRDVVRRSSVERIYGS